MRPRLRLALLPLLLGCSDQGPEPGDLCPQTFGDVANSGCARVSGTVQDVLGQPIAGVIVTLHPPEGAPGEYDLPSFTTTTQGSFLLEIHRFDEPTEERAADTVAMYLRGVLPEEPEVRDSVLIDVIFVPVDSVARTVEENLVLSAEEG